MLRTAFRQCTEKINQHQLNSKSSNLFVDLLLLSLCQLKLAAKRTHPIHLLMKLSQFTSKHNFILKTRQSTKIFKAKPTIIVIVLEISLLKGLISPLKATSKIYRWIKYNNRLIRKSIQNVQCIYYASREQYSWDKAVAEENIWDTIQRFGSQTIRHITSIVHARKLLYNFTTL